MQEQVVRLILIYNIMLMDKVSVFLFLLKDNILQTYATKQFVNSMNYAKSRSSYEKMNCFFYTSSPSLFLLSA